LDRTYVAEEDGKVVGYISFSKRIHEDEWSGRHYRLDHLIVDEKHRRKGLGTQLLTILLQAAQKHDANVVLNTLINNEDAIAFFKSFGFKPLETTLLLDRKTT
jgi:ribosomal protein S18 acetylase RimI-like enzyme